MLGWPLREVDTIMTAVRPEKPLHVGKPSWLKTKIPTGDTYFRIKRDLREKNLFTVCEEAKCPNIGECWNTNTATFMVLGDTCTRACRFCNVKTGSPEGWLDLDEPRKTAVSAQIMGLKYVVITMVDRDDLPDGGATHVGRVVTEVKAKNPGIVVELLAGDFQENDRALETILNSKPEVFAHNLETVKELTPRVRDARAGYKQSLRVLRRVKELAGHQIFTKSALMLGLGESREQVVNCLKDMREYGVDFLTIGQYMRPTKRHLSIKRFVSPEEFEEYRQLAVALGFKSVAASPLVRSSYKAHKFYQQAIALHGVPSP